MDRERLVRSLTGLLDQALAEELVADFIEIRQDYATKTLGRASPGKFVETLVQCLQYMDTGKYDAKPRVDEYLNTKVESTGLDEDLRICAARIGRSIYTLRNKRNIAHKGAVDPNSFDLAYIHQGSAWIMAELIRHATGLSMAEAGVLIDLVQAPVGTLVEDIGGTRLVHGNVSVRAELLILLHSRHPDVVQARDILASLSRRKAITVRNRLRELHDEKLVHGDAKGGYRLTSAGCCAAIAEREKLVQ